MNDDLLKYAFDDNLKKVKEIISDNPNIINKRYGPYKLHILHHVIISNSNKVLNYLLKYGINPNIVTIEKVSPLHTACKNGNNYAVKKLLYYLANVNQITKKGKTPLLIASQKGYYQIVLLLLKSGANINIKEKKKSSISCRLRTPIQIAEECGHKNIVKKLTKRIKKKLFK